MQPAALLTYDQTFTGECRRKFSESRVRQAVVNERLDAGKKEALDTWHKLSLTKKPKPQTMVQDLAFSKGMDFVRDQVGPIEPDKEFEEQCVEGDGASAKKADENRALAALFIFIAALLVFILIVVLCFGLLSAEAMLALKTMIPPRLVPVRHRRRRRPSAHRCGRGAGHRIDCGRLRRPSAHRLISILDHDAVPASEWAALSNGRGEIETTLDELKTHPSRPRPGLRSRPPDGRRAGSLGPPARSPRDPPPHARHSPRSRHRYRPALLDPLPPHRRTPSQRAGSFYPLTA